MSLYPSAQKIQNLLNELGYAYTVIEHAESTRTAQEAADITQELQRLAGAMGVTLSDFFALDGALVGLDGAGDSAGNYLRELKLLLPQLSPDQRQQLLETVKQMARARKV